LVVVERTVDPGGRLHAEASARFVRIAAPWSAQDAMRAIGAALDLPPRGRCATTSSLGGVTTSAEPLPAVELVDVGPVSLEVAGTQTHLLPRQLPDVTDLVSGVVYSRATDPSSFPAAASYALHVGGSVSGRLDLAPFDVAAAAPADPSDVVIGGAVDQATVVVTTPTLQVSWTSAGDSDLVYLDIQPTGIRCLLVDGMGGPAHEQLAIVSSKLLDDAGMLTVHRLHREPIRAAGLEGAEVRFDFARSVAYVRR
jgi:hypothetical protein